MCNDWQLKRKTSIAAVIVAICAEAIGAPEIPLVVEDESTAPYAFTGIVGTYESWGSGVAAAHPNIILSCAHVVFSFDSLLWTSGARWYRAWNEPSEPIDSESLALDGYFYWSSYASAARATAASYSELKEAREFNNDFVAYYRAGSPVAGGSFAAVWTNGATPLASESTEKLITGYPMGRYTEGDPAEFRMHETILPGTLSPAFKNTKNYLLAYE